jgi:hypothetical protein
MRRTRFLRNAASVLGATAALVATVYGTVWLASATTAGYASMEHAGLARRLELPQTRALQGWHVWKLTHAPEDKRP